MFHCALQAKEDATELQEKSKEMKVGGVVLQLLRRVVGGACAG